ncbi:hypothetical protein [Rufibacter latericius]|uniref:STAS/SEC14 domain-containing protein n=1 Tax=Rufibacter latericius TaxID=2487040 RepID=A0A3M9MUP0_9BACT|nr:hypothetical protein [Rufibacter latericius]RNI29241.1 hypothetical protein EFB08_07420 [Rufibacter latericius]
MHNRTLLQEPHLNIRLDLLTDILRVEWTGPQTEETVKDGCEKILKHVASTRTSKVLNNNSPATGNWSGAADWAAKIWFPALHKAGVKFFAWVLSPELYSQLSTKETLKNNIKGILVLSFEERDPAENWLKVM